MNITVLLVLMVLAYITLGRRLKNIENKIMEASISPLSEKFVFDLHKFVLSSPQILERAGVTRKQKEKNYDEWPKALKKKWYGFLENENSHLGTEYAYPQKLDHKLRLKKAGSFGIGGGRPICGGMGVRRSGDSHVGQDRCGRTANIFTCPSACCVLMIAA